MVLASWVLGSNCCPAAGYSISRPGVSAITICLVGESAGHEQAKAEMATKAESDWTSHRFGELNLKACETFAVRAIEPPGMEFKPAHQRTSVRLIAFDALDCNRLRQSARSQFANQLRFSRLRGSRLAIGTIRKPGQRERRY